jgi:hypothetical protein
LYLWRCVDFDVTVRRRVGVYDFLRFDINMFALRVQRSAANGVPCTARHGFLPRRR